jgi:hypothetical protein
MTYSIQDFIPCAIVELLNGIELFNNGRLTHHEEDCQYGRKDSRGVGKDTQLSRSSQRES